MDLDGIVHVCDTLGLRCGRERQSVKRGPQVSIACPMAPWNHGDPDDRNMSCSVSIDPDGPSWARCFSWNCDFKGSFLRMIQTVVGKHPNPERFTDFLKFCLSRDKDDIESRAARAITLISTQRDNRQRALERAFAPPLLLQHEQDVLPEIALEFCFGTVPKYVLSRGVSIDTCKAWEIGYDRAHERVVFPVRRRDGALVGLTGRILPSAVARAEACDEIEPTKYHNYAGLNKTRYLYGSHLWVKGLPIVIVEGPLDAIRVWEALQGRANVCATLGQGFTQEHRRLIRNFSPPAVYIFGDGDDAGRRMSEKIEHVLHRDVSLFLMRCPVDTHLEFDSEIGEEIEVKIELDPGACSDEQINAAFDAADPVLDGIHW